MQPTSMPLSTYEYMRSDEKEKFIREEKRSDEKRIDEGRDVR